jgi:hypothetical protein
MDIGLPNRADHFRERAVSMFQLAAKEQLGDRQALFLAMAISYGELIERAQSAEN